MSRLRNAIGLAILLLAAVAAWPLSAADEKKATSDKPPAAKPADPYAVSDGTPKELAEFIKKLTATPPRNAETQKKMREAVLKAAEKILAGKPSEEELEVAVQAKMSVLQNDPQKLVGLAEELKRGGHERLARRVRVLILQMDLYNAALTANREKIKSSVDDVVKFLEEAPPQATDVSLAFMAGRLAEISDDTDLAANAYRSFAKTFAASKDPKAADFAKMCEASVRRMTLPGNAMKIEGKLLGGAPFDWSKYAGKVVLVDFWASWNVACVAEIPSMKKSYDLYHDKGFEIVGLSYDRSLAELKRFAEEKNIPWPIVFGDEKPSPTFVYYGIMAIPTTVLVGKDGKVVSLNTRGEKLKEELAKLLGPVEEKKDAKGAAKNQHEKAKKADIVKKN
jgi:thiol-disulfide isomerase/thioredoxin